MGDCADTVRESALKADCGRKLPCCIGDSNPCQYCTIAFQSDALPTELSPPPPPIVNCTVYVYLIDVKVYEYTVSWFH